MKKTAIAGIACCVILFGASILMFLNFIIDPTDVEFLINE
jgi:hypothetical protein